MRKRSFQIALSAVSCALATLFLAGGINLPMGFASGYLLGALALMLPLAKEMRLGGFLAYVATCLLCLPFGGIAQFYKLFPFIVFFGLHPLVNSFQNKFKVKRWLAFIIKDVWFVGAMMLSWLLFDQAVEISLPFAWMYDWIYLIIAVGGTALFFVYDFIMLRAQKIVSYYVARIDRSGQRKPPAAPPSREIGDVFGEMSSEEKKGEDERKDSDEGH